MRRFARHLLTFCSALSVLLCLTAGAFWVRSFWVADFASYRRLGRPGFVQWDVDSVHRSIHLVYLKTPGSLPPGEPAGFGFESMPAARSRVLNSRWGFGHASRSGAGFAYREVWFPHLLAVLVFGCLALPWPYSRWRSRRRVSSGLCTRCGYDLRASAGRCPECGGEQRGDGGAPVRRTVAGS
jgi:hypothetical protein